MAIADEVQRRYPQARILFVGAEGKMEMEKVPQAGYPIVGLPIRGIQRSLSLTNLWLNASVPFKLLSSYWQACQLLKKERPQAVVGVGGYASGPLLLAARSMGVPYLIQEQNSFAGITNRWLAKGAAAICTAYPDMELQLPGKHLVLTGNPVRAGYEPERLENLRDEAIAHFGLVDKYPTLLITGGSLGARTLNQALDAGLEKLAEAGFQVLWQTGKGYAAKAEARVAEAQKMWTSANPGEERPGKLVTSAFIARMDLAYAAADVVVARAGALTLSELCLARKPAILVPSPNVAEDHQTHNARALASRDAAMLVPDVEAATGLIHAAINLLNDAAKRERFSQNMGKLAFPYATAHIVDELEKIILPN